MLNSRKGNLSCFQWEVERFQQSHRENMAAITPQINNKDATMAQQYRRQVGGTRKRLAREQLAEIDKQKNNAWLIERMVRIHRIGGFQRRYLHEFQDVKAALQFGKTNVGVSRAVNERRFSRRKKTQELVRLENAKFFMRLASPKRSGIDFNKFETDFTKSREHRRLAQCNRTVGHTAVFSSVKAQTPCLSADNNTPSGLPMRLRKQLSTKEQQNEQPDYRLSPEGLKPGSSPTLGPKLSSNSNAGNRNRSAADDIKAQIMARNGGNASESWGVTPRRPHTAGGCRRSSPSLERPRTALGWQSRSDHRDFFDARAADPGWGNSSTSPARRRPPSAPERRRRDFDATIARRREPPPSARITRARGEPVGGHRSSRPETTPNCTGRKETHAEGSKDGHDDDRATELTDEDSAEFPTDRGECGGRGAPTWCLGRTLLVKAKVLISSAKPDDSRMAFPAGGRARRRLRQKVGLRLFSIDGLIRQREGVQKTLRGFVAEASPITRPRVSPPFGRATVVNGKGATCSGSVGLCYTPVAIPAVQGYLESAGLGLPAGDVLEPFRAACPMDDRGNYPEVNALLGQVGQRTLYQILLGSCHVSISGGRSEGRIGVELLRVNAEGVGVSATATSTRPKRQPRLERPQDGNPAMARPGAHKGAVLQQSNGMKDTASPSVGSVIAAEGLSADPTTRATFFVGREPSDKQPLIVIRMPHATESPSTLPDKVSEEGSDIAGEVDQSSEEDQDQDQDQEADDDDEYEGNGIDHGD